MVVPTERLREFVASMESGTVAVFPTAPEQRRSNDTHFPFRPDSDFYYLTGFDEPEAIAVLSKRAGSPTYTLFLRPRDPALETWTGRRVGPERACARLGCDEAYPLGELDSRMPGLLQDTNGVYWAMGRYPEWDRRLLGWIDGTRMRIREMLPPRRYLDPSPVLHELRLRKSSRELETLRRAIAISAEAHREAMAATRPGMHEYEIQAIVEYVFRRRGAQAPGYDPIVGAGANATILHYISNREALKAGELLLVDAGAELDLYTGDITRTWPINGTFDPLQRRAYELVLHAQKVAIAAIKPGATIADVHRTAVRALVEGFKALGLIVESVDESLATGSYKKFYMHRTSHWLGMDVHDAGDYLRAGAVAQKPGHDGLDADYPALARVRPLEPGMVITVEPGLYVDLEATLPDGAHPALRGLGIRIEDDVLVTADGYEVLSRDCPKEVADVEREVARPSMFT
jgi:Xaa-Pro aminopeptidase